MTTTTEQVKTSSPAWGKETDYKLRYFHLLNDYDRLLLCGLSREERRHTQRLLLAGSLIINLMMALALGALTVAASR